MTGKFYAIGHNTKKVFKGIFSKPKTLTIRGLQKHLLMTEGVVLAVVTKERYDLFDPKDVSVIDLAGELKEEGELEL